jgi:hypothetical protein
MLNSRNKILILLLAILVFAIPALINQLATSLNLKVNPTNINLYQSNTTVEYLYENGTYGISSTLTLQIDANVTSKITKITVNLGGSIRSYYCNYTTGCWLDNGTPTANYTIFWILVQNPMLHGWEFALFKNTSVVDPIGLIGPTGAIYTLIIGRKIVYWDVAPAEDGAQFSFEITLYNSELIKVADGIMDSTCGFLEILQGGPNNARIEIASPGSFQISRNRYIMLTWGLVFAIGLPIASFAFMKWKKVEKNKIEEFTLLVAVGSSATIIDIDLDVWFYARLGFEGMLLVHFITIVCYALICVRLKYGIKWCILGFMEILYVFAITKFVGDPYVPHLTAFMGLLLTFLAMVFRSGIDKKNYDDKLDFVI